jgi:signal transduction histidine kinase
MMGPQPGVDDLQGLIARMREAGLPLDYDVDGQPVPLPAALDLAIYRFVQEALTNVLKHAGQVRTQVQLAFRPEAVAVEVVNEAGRETASSEAPAGHGLIGMRERATVFGGEFRAGPRPGGGFAVVARLPLGSA